jgi:hypothetical protein
VIGVPVCNDQEASNGPAAGIVALPAWHRFRFDATVVFPGWINFFAQPLLRFAKETLITTNQINKCLQVI